MLTIGNAITVGKYSYAGSAGFTYAVRFMYPIDINNDGIKELICAGLESQPTGNNLGHSILTQVNIFGWQDGIFVNITKQWMPDNIGGGIGDVTSGDFNHDGLTDLYLSTYTDTNIRGNPIELLNNGTSFNKVVLPSGIAEHGITSGDVNNDGYTDVLTAGYEEQQSMYLGGPNGLTKTPILGITWALNGSNVAIGDFLGDGSKSFVVSDSGCGKIFLGTSLFKITKSSSNSVSVDYVSDLPAPLMGDKSHDFRIRTMDFNHDGLDDVIVFSRETFDGTKWPENARIQFYLNKGNGVFDDVTSTELVGFDTHCNLSYNPIFEDFNGDGLIDIFTSETSWEGNSNSTAILMQQPNGTFVHSYRKELSALVKPNGGLSTIMKGSDNAWYLVSEYQQRGGDASLTMYKLDFNVSAVTLKIPVVDITTPIVVPIIPVVSTNPSPTDDMLTGTNKADKLNGLVGNDTFIGGLGADKLTGGLGADVFKYNSVADSTPKSHDVITDFKRAQGDKIDLSAIDANTSLMGNQEFTFIGSKTFSKNHPAELRFDAKTHTLYGNTDNDSAAEFAIVLNGVKSLVVDDFIL